jgi:hypothetical protein
MVVIKEKRLMDSAICFLSITFFTFITCITGAFVFTAIKVIAYLGFGLMRYALFTLFVGCTPGSFHRKQSCMYFGRKLLYESEEKLYNLHVTEGYCFNFYLILFRVSLTAGSVTIKFIESFFVKVSLPS